MYALEILPPRRKSGWQLKTAGLALAGIVLFIATDTLAQTPGTTGTAQTNNQNVSQNQKKGVGDTEFVKKAAMSDMFEIQSSQLALTKSQNTEVKAFAQHMITDHTAASARLKTAASVADVMAPPPEAKLDSKHQMVIDKLTAASGTEFDRMYVEAQAKAHKEAVALFDAYATAGSNPALKTFASQTLPTLKGHMDHVKSLPGAKPAM